MSDKLTVNSKSTGEELKAYLTQQGIEFGSKANKAELLSLCGIDVNAEAIADLTTRMDASDKEVKDLKSENVILGEANTKLTDDNKNMAKEIAKLNKAPKSDKKKAEKPTVPKGTFKADDVEYKFLVAIIKVAGFDLMTAKDALNNKEVQARLVELNATGIIEKV